MWIGLTEMVADDREQAGLYTWTLWTRQPAQPSSGSSAVHRFGDRSGRTMQVDELPLSQDAARGR
jgi:hypothetical protein